MANPSKITEQHSTSHFADAPPKSPRSRLFNVYVGDEFFEVEVDPARPSRAAVTCSAMPAQREPDLPSTLAHFVDAPPKSPRSRLFNVYVGDEFFEVEIDPARPSRAAVTRSAMPAQREPDLPSTPSPAETKTIPAPMPGIVLSYIVEVGQKVAEGEPVVVLQAMKMENVLPSPVAGTVNGLPLQKGATVSTGDVLAVIAIEPREFR